MSAQMGCMVMDDSSDCNVLRVIMHTVVRIKQLLRTACSSSGLIIAQDQSHFVYRLLAFACPRANVLGRIMEDINA